MRLNDLPRYRSFIEGRDRAIEALFHRAMDEANDLLRGSLETVVMAMISQYDSALKDPNPAQAIRAMAAVVDGIFSQLAKNVSDIQSRMMGQVEMLAAAGETEALGRAKGKATRLELKFKKHFVNQEGAPLAGRARAGLHKIETKLMGAFQTSIWLTESLEEFKARLTRALPSKTRYKRPPRVLKPLKESEEFDDDLMALGADVLRTKAGKIRLSQTIMSDDEWQDLVSHVVEKYVPSFRGPEAILDPGSRVTIDSLRKTFETETERYAWEFEQEVANELVRQTVNGSNEAARQNGVTTFTWIAIVDDKTDECCLWRDGLTVEEIAEALQNEHEDDECQAFAPPAHFNCRCRLAPVLNIDDLERPPSNLPEFDEWLTTI